jgi:hypothetical protein
MALVGNSGDRQKGINQTQRQRYTLQRQPLWVCSGGAAMIAPAGSEIGADRQPAAAPWDGSRRLWSLWDMLSIKAGPFASAIATMGGLNATTAILQGREGVFTEEVTEGIRAQCILQLAKLKEHCLELDLSTTLSAVENCISFLEKGTPNWPRTANSLIVYICNVLPDELRGKAVLILSRAEAEHYSAPRSRWEEVIARFGGTVIDIEEMSKCYAFGRYAASIYHSLQIVEIGLIDLGKIIGAKDHQTGWNATTTQLQKIKSTKYPDRTQFQQSHSGFLEQIAALIEHMKYAWRNKVSHAEGKLTLMTSDFSAEVAMEIIIASRAFMRRLATEAPSTPDPDV